MKAVGNPSRVGTARNRQMLAHWERVQNRLVYELQTFDTVRIIEGNA